MANLSIGCKADILHGNLHERVYIGQPPGYVKQGSEAKVYKLKKALYGLKQAPRTWYTCIEAYFEKAGFYKCPYKHSIFNKFSTSSKILIVCLNVDDLIYTRNEKSMMDDFKQSLMSEFEMYDLCMMCYFLGIQVVQSASWIFIMQKKYALEILDKFQMSSCN